MKRTKRSKDNKTYEKVQNTGSEKTEEDSDDEDDKSENTDFKGFGDFTSSSLKQLGELKNLSLDKENLFDYRSWTLRRQIVCSACISLIIMALILIVAVTLCMNYVNSVVTDNVSNITLIMKKTTEDNLNDLCNQTNLNYKTFIKEVTVK